MTPPFGALLSGAGADGAAATAQMMAAMEVLALSGVRVAAFFAISPFTGRGLPASVRGGLVVAIALLLAPVTAAGLKASGPAGPLLFAKEALLGLVLGLLAWTPVRSLELAGVLLDTQRGATTAEDFNPLYDAQTTPASQFLMQAFSGFFFASGGLLVALGLVLSSLQAWPVAAAAPQLTREGAAIYAATAGQLFLFGLVYAAPILGFMLLADLAIGFIAKQAPQIEALTFGMPVKSLIMLFTMLFSLDLLYPMILAAIGDGETLLRRVLPL